MSSSPRAHSPHAHGAADSHSRSERRRMVRGSYDEPSRTRLIALVLGTYQEMPGLSLNLREAARLFGLRETTCAAVLDHLVGADRLRRSPEGRYLRLRA